MLRIARAPPVVGLALAALTGALLHHLGVPLSWTFLSFLLLLRPSPPSFRPRGLSRPAPPPPRRNSPLLPLLLAFTAGGLLTRSWISDRAADCRLFLAENASIQVRGRMTGRIVDGRGELQVGSGLPGGCAEPIRFVLSGDDLEKESALAPGGWVELSGRWRRRRVGSREDPLRAGYLRVEEVSGERGAPGRAPDPGRWRGRVQLRLGELFPREAPLVEALVLARKEGLSSSIREAFAAAGTAHLLAISGFHVGVVGGLLLLLGGLLGLSHPLRYLLGSLGVWAYVLLIGLPDAAFRAALILTLLALGRLARRPVLPMGALATAFLTILLLDPGALLRPGFQLSFAGAFGLVAWSGPISRSLETAPLFRRRRALASAVSAGVSATLATLPLVAWHFGRVSLVGIPATLLSAPLVALAIPGIFLSLLLSTLSLPAGVFLAGGVEVLLAILTGLVEWVGGLPFASAWISRPGVVWGGIGAALGLLWYRRPSRSWRGGRGKSLHLALGVASGLLGWPAAELALHRGTLEVVMLDVGQGDALLLRSPRDRWILVDAGPRTPGFDAGARTVLPYLRRRGVRELALLLLTHPDMDHVGGAEAVLEGISVNGVMDPGKVVGTEVFLHALEAAEAGGVPWRLARAGDSLNLDGVALRVLWPPGEGVEGMDPNEASVVVEVRFGAFAFLLTGDAGTGAESEFLSRLHSPSVQVLKMGHHGSATSTSPELLERTSPSLALVSVGRRNRYGHPHPSVLRRLESAGTRVLRTDLDGPLTIRARKDGAFRVLRLTGE